MSAGRRTALCIFPPCFNVSLDENLTTFHTCGMRSVQVWLPCGELMIRRLPLAMIGKSKLKASSLPMLGQPETN